MLNLIAFTATTKQLTKKQAVISIISLHFAYINL